MRLPPGKHAPQPIRGYHAIELFVDGLRCFPRPPLVSLSVQKVVSAALLVVGAPGQGLVQFSLYLGWDVASDHRPGLSQVCARVGVLHDRGLDANRTGVVLDVAVAADGVRIRVEPPGVKG